MADYHDTLVPLAEGNAGVWQTVQRMRDLIIGVGSLRRDAVNDQIIEQTFYWVRGHLLYQEHPPGEQTIIAPRALLAMIDQSPDHRAIGDCVSYTVLLGYLLWPMGVPMRLVVRSKRPDGIFDHVYLRVRTSKGWMAADASGDAAFGWEDPEVTAREEMAV